MATQLRWMTADELLAMPNDGMRRELVDGDLREMSPTNRQHARLARNFLRYLDAYVLRNGLGEALGDFGYKLADDPDTVRAPDVSFVRLERLESGGPEQGYFQGHPDLAVEVVSPNDRPGEVRRKVHEYLRAGTPMVVVVDPRRESVTVHRSGTDIAVLFKDDVLEGGDVVPGWTLPVCDIFA